MFDTRNNLSHQVMSEIRNHFGDKVFTSIIPRNVRLSEAPSHGRSIFEYDGKSIGANRYRSLARELDERVRGTFVSSGRTPNVNIQVDTQPLDNQPMAEL
jgi:chromosome partitioning protein